MRVWRIGLFLLVFIYAVDAHADGALYMGDNFSDVVFALTANQAPQQANEQALRACAREGSFNCRLIRQFKNTCLAFSFTKHHDIELYEDPAGETAATLGMALQRCSKAHADCKRGLVQCDGVSNAGAQTIVEPVPWIDFNIDVFSTPLPILLSAVFASGFVLALTPRWYAALRGRTAAPNRNPPPVPAPIEPILSTYGPEPRQSSIQPPPLPVAAAIQENFPTPEPSRSLSIIPSEASIPEPERRSIDTPAAMQALRLAAAFLLEVLDETEYGDEQVAKTVRTTLALAAKQLDIAHHADPNAVLQADEAKYTQAQLRSRTLTIEARTWFPHNQTKAIAIADKAKAADALNVDAWFWSGWFNFQQRNREAAIRDFERTLELEPDNIEALKFLDRTKNMGGGEIAAFKVVNARDNTLFAVGKTLRILRIPFLIISAPFRFIFFIGKTFYLSWLDPWHWLRR